MKTPQNQDGNSDDEIDEHGSLNKWQKSNLCQTIGKWRDFAKIL